MNPLLKLIIRFAIVFVVIFIAIQPYNWFCGLTQKCDSFHFSYLIPKKEGFDQFKFQLGAINYSGKFSFESVDKTLSTVINRKNTIHYHAKNLSKKTVYLRPKLLITPPEFEPHIKIYDCLCSKVYKLKKGEEIDLKMTFVIKSSINDLPLIEDYRNTEKIIGLGYFVK